MVGRGSGGYQWPGVMSWVEKRWKVSLVVSLQVLGKVGLSRLWKLRRMSPCSPGCAQPDKPCRFPGTPLICCPFHMMFSNKQSSMASLDKQIMASGKPWVLMTCYVFAMRGGRSWLWNLNAVPLWANSKQRGWDGDLDKQTLLRSNEKVFPALWPALSSSRR